MNRGTAHAELGNYDMALANYDRAEALESDNLQLFANRAYALE